MRVWNRDPASRTHLGDEQDEERIDVLGRRWGVVHLARVGVRISDADRLVKEKHVGGGVPGVLVVGDVLTLVDDRAAAELKEKAGGRGAAGTAVEPGSGFSDCAMHMRRDHGR